MTRIFVAGATGVIGRRVVPLLTAGGHEVTAAGRNPERRAALERAGARVVVLDLFDPRAVRRVVAGHDVVINLATHIPSSGARMMLPWSWRENDRVRRDGSAALAQAARTEGAARFIQESFAPIYEDGGSEWLDEGAPVRPTSYNRTVLDAERSAETFTGAGRAGVVLRFAGFYGPDARHLLEMLSYVRRGRSPIPGAADAYISAVSHDDAARAVVTALGLPAGTYNVADDDPLTRRDFLDALADAFGAPRPRLLPRWTVKLMGPVGELLARSQRMSNRKLRAHGWTPAYPSVREGFRATAAELRASDAAPAIAELRRAV